MKIALLIIIAAIITKAWQNYSEDTYKEKGNIDTFKLNNKKKAKESK